MSIGIYMLRNEIDGKVYIGQSTNLEKRNDLIAKVVEMKKQGISTKEIANKFNINSSTVNRYFKAANTEVIQ